MYIDARQEKFSIGDAKKVTYSIKGVNDDIIKEKITTAVGLHAIKIEVIPSTEKVNITYFKNVITPTFIDYLFQLKGIEFTRENEQ